MKREDGSKWIRYLLIGCIPYILFLVGIFLISLGMLKYIENDSLIAGFLSDRDAPVFKYDLLVKDWNEQVPVIDDPPEVTQPKEIVSNEDIQLKVPFFYIDDQIGVIDIPSIDLKVTVYQGDQEEQLKKGAGHYTGSFFPGQEGNILIAGHRTSYFRDLEYVSVGDEINYTSSYGKFTYKIDEIRIIDGSDESIANKTPLEQLTLYTCYPFTFIGNAPNRYVLLCSLVKKEIYR